MNYTSRLSEVNPNGRPRSATPKREGSTDDHQTADLNEQVGRQDASAPSKKEQTASLRLLPISWSARKFAAYCMTAASFGTTIIGARLYATSNPLVATALSVAMQVGILSYGHAPDAEGLKRGYKHSPLLRLGVLVPCLAFSVWMSALCAFYEYRPQVETGYVRQDLQTKLRYAAGELKRAKTEALAFLNQQVSAADAQAKEKARIAKALHNRRGKFYAWERASKLKDRLTDLEDRREKIGQVQLVSELMPESFDEARKRIDQAQAGISTILAQAPADFSFQAAPQPPETERPVDIQAAFLAELKQHSPGALMCLFFGLAIDLITVGLLRSERPLRTLPELWRDTRRYRQEWRSALAEPLNDVAEPLIIEVAEHPGLSLHLDLRSAGRELYLEDLAEHFPALERIISERLREEVTISGAQSSLGVELLNGLPLSNQLGPNRKVYLTVQQRAVAA